MSDKLTYVYRHHPQPGREYYVQELGTGICCQHEDSALALALFESIWAGRSPYQLIEHAPPQPKRRDEPRPVSAAIEGEGDGVKFHRALLRRWHPDLHSSKRKYTAQEITAAINEAWEQTRPK